MPEKYYIEPIKCAECGSDQYGIMIPDLPFSNFVHECSECSYITMASEWNNQEIRGLTVKEPYASLVLDHSKIETRTWPTKWRGMVMLHAAKTPHSKSSVKQLSGAEHSARISAMLQSSKPTENRNGKIIAVAFLTDCRPMVPADAEKCFVPYNPDLYCHVFENIRPVHPVECSGKLSYWKTDFETIQKLKFLEL